MHGRWKPKEKQKEGKKREKKEGRGMQKETQNFSEDLVSSSSKESPGSRPSPALKPSAISSHDNKEVYQNSGRPRCPASPSPFAPPGSSSPFHRPLGDVKGHKGGSFLRSEGGSGYKQERGPAEGDRKQTSGSSGEQADEGPANPEEWKGLDVAWPESSGTKKFPLDRLFCAGVSLAQEGSGVPLNLDKAMKFTRRAALAGNRCAAAECFLKGVDLGPKSIKDLEECFKVYETAAQAGHPHGWYRFAELLQLTTGESAFKYYEVAANLRHAGGVIKTGSALCQGDGVEKDREAAESWFVLADQLGVPNAGYLLSTLYHNQAGQSQHARDRTLFWLERSAQKGHLRSMMVFGAMLMGQGEEGE
eukprot:CAMPEP_0184479948 /NCGR_PEP_ID=MMETSP0113_2-20130426/1466_1 /TAXON_ID=91329 /ORGANISM="Norrisiella sphaerica, Strain BC52" /LENGTH=361 /DNA_ID=CAMNT_0026858125 /DNA_START=148 /DNA_END=1230 /DNA_ORIENTATION=+